MPGENIQDWSTSAASNANSDTSINWAEGQTRASVNNSARSMMAAHAKNRNLQNGSIVTGGTANAQTFFSGLDYTTVPTGLLVLLKIGPTLTNTGPATLNMDNIGAVTVKTQAGDDLVPDALIENGYGQFVYNGTNWVLLYYTVTTIGTSAVTLQKFTASGTYIPPEGTQFIIVECIGGGGGGGSSTASANTSFQGGGGGGGSYSRSILTAVAFGTSQVVTIGAGGAAGSNSAGGPGSATSFGALCTANGGSGGNPANSSVTPFGGSGGAAGTGDIAVAGTPGGWGFYNNETTGTDCLAGNGGAGPFGGGSVTGLGGVGTAGAGYGSGGSGGNAFNTTINFDGGAGAAGLCIVTEYNIAVQGPQGASGTPGAPGGLTTPLPPHGRLTLQSGTPVMTADVISAQNVYYTPYRGTYVPIFDGTNWATTPFTQLTLALAGSANWVAASVYDLFVVSDAGTLRLGTGPAWTSITARGVGAGTTELQQLNGIWTNKNVMTLRYAAATTVSVPVNRGTYVGSVCMTAAGTTQMAFKPAAASGGSLNYLGLYNAYNRVRTKAICRSSTASWTFTNTTPAALDGGSGGGAAFRIYFLDGLSQSFIEPSIAAYGNQLTNGAVWVVGVTLDNPAATPVQIVGHNSTVNITVSENTDFFTPQLGLHFVTGVQYVSSSTGTVFGSNTSMSLALDM